MASTLPYGLPFFFTFIYVEKSMLPIMVTEFTDGAVFYILVIDWISALAIFIIGGVIGWLAYFLTARTFWLECSSGD